MRQPHQLVMFWMTILTIFILILSARPFATTGHEYLFMGTIAFLIVAAIVLIVRYFVPVTTQRKTGRPPVATGMPPRSGQ